MRQHRDCGDLPPWTYIQLLRYNQKFYIEGRFVGQYDRHRKLRRVVFLFRDTEEEISRKFILDTALSQTKIFPWFFDPDSNLLTIDRRWFAYLELPNDGDTISAETFFSLVHPDDRKALSQAFANRLAGEPAPDTVTYRLRRGDGTWEWFEEQSVSPGRTADGLPYRIAGICQSIQAHKEVEGRLREARDKARENDRLKSAFLANMSHEIRTPLNAIIGFANLVTCDDVPFSETERQEYSRLISANGDQLLRLISDILDLSKIESNTMEFCFGDQSLHTLLSDIYQSQLLTMPPQVELRLELPQADTTIRTDASRLKQVINNLINNAAKFTDRAALHSGTARTRARERSNCSSGIRGKAFRRSTWAGYSSVSTKPTPMRRASGWGFPSAARSLKYSAATSRSSPHRAKAPALRSCTPSTVRKRRRKPRGHTGKVRFLPRLQRST